MVKNTYITTTSSVFFHIFNPDPEKDLKITTKTYKSTLYTYLTNCIFIVIFTTSPTFLLSQNLNFGISKINSFDKREFGFGTQTWEAEVLENGKMIFANNGGLLEYNGQDWITHPLPKKTICRSISVDKNNRIFAGGQDEIGFFTPDHHGTLQFTSIRSYIPEEYRSLTDIWDLVSNNNKTYFRSNNTIYIYKDNKEVICIPELNEITLLEEVDGRILYFTQGKGIYEITNDQAKLVKNSENLADYLITGISTLEPNTWLIATLKNGLKILDYAGVRNIEVPYQNYLKKNLVQDIFKLPQDQFAISTERAGMLIVDKDLVAVKKITKEDGLASNRIHCMALDQNENLWLGLSYGIDQVLLSDGLTTFSPDGIDQGSVYDIEEYQGKLYFGTNDGVYYINKQDYYNPFKKLNFSFVENTEGQVWGMDVIDDILFIGHNDGAFLLENNFARKISGRTGAWKFLQIGADKIAVGTYYGIDIFEDSQNGYKLYRHIDGFEESSRIMVVDKQGFIWVSHPYRGIYRINPFTRDEQEVVTEFGLDEGLPSQLLNYIFDINNEIYVTSKTGIYKYISSSNSFELDPVFNNQIDSTKNVRRLFEFVDGEIWYVAEHEVGRFIPGDRVAQEGYFHQKWQEIQLDMVGGFENLFIDSDKNVLICTDKGVMNLDVKYDKSNDTIIANINKAVLTSESNKLLFDGYFSESAGISFVQKKDSIYQLDADVSDIKFHFASNNLNPKAKIQYSYNLEGYDDGWSEWSHNSEKEYTQLDFGDYDFRVKSKDDFSESLPSSLKFHIKPNWYETNLAHLLWVLLGIVAVRFIYYLSTRKYAKETDILRVQQEEKKREIEKLKTEKLQSEIAFKDKELASSTMHLVQKNETINKLRIDLESLQSDIGDKNTKKEIKKILSTINDNNRLEDEWENFAVYFDRVHTNFLQRISKEFPMLTNKDLKLAAYLRMNLNTKEIAPLLNISVRGVEISRYRLRKKMSIEGDTNLNEFMMNY